MNIKNARYVDASDLFDGLDRLWDIFENSGPDCSFGDNNRTLVSPETVTNAIDGVIDEENEAAKSQYETLKERIAELPAADEATGMVYIDLEN